ncbi:MAG: CHAT domain-containing tetratricopeptide repeat protein [Chloroflexota bacterium]|nr:CHAT domain-containing tetratricopeptide repeat protein [Chloroflexota bacterium]
MRSPPSTTGERWPDVAACLSEGAEPETTLSLSRMLDELERLVHSDPTDAVSAADEAIDLVDTHGGTALRMRARRMLVIACAHANQFVRSLGVREEAEQIPDAEEAPVELARIRVASMQALASLDRIDEAILVGQAALATLEAHGAETPARMAALNIGASFAMTGRPDEALPFFDRAGRGLDDNPVLLGQVETNRGTALAALDRFEEAEVAFERAISLLNSDEMSWAGAIAEGNLAYLAGRQGAINRSLRHSETARRYLEQDSAHGDVGRINAEQAALLAAAGLTTEARAGFAEAIELIRQHGNPFDLARAQIAFATTLVAAGGMVDPIGKHREGAGRALREAEALLIESGQVIDADEHPDIWRQYLALRAQLALAAGDDTTARTLIDNGLRLAEDRPVQRLRWLVLQADLARVCNRADEARDILRGALVTAESARVTPVIAELHESLADLERQVGDRVAADGHARRAINAYEAIRGTLQAERLRQSWHRGRLDVYGDLYLSLVARDDAASQHEAFGVAERIRSRSLLDAMKRRVPDADPTVSTDASERPLIDRLAEHRRWLNWMYSALADGLEPDERQQRDLHQRELAAGSLEDRLALLRPQPGFDTPLALEQVQALLDDSTVILSYLAIGDRLSLQVISSDRVEGMVELATLPAIVDLVANLQFQISRVLLRSGSPISPNRLDRLRRDTEAVLADLYRALIAPVQARLVHARRIVVIPTSDLHAVPFAALHQDGTYLGDQRAVVTSPGVSVLTGMGAASADNLTETDRTLVVAVPDDDAPGMRDEAERLRRRFPSGTFLVAADATRDMVLDSILEKDLVHIACHGRFDSTHPNATGLRLADGWLTLDRLREVRLGGALVVLTGCETARVRVEDGDDLVGMMAAMIAAGSSGLVASLWKTHDVAATALVEAFYDAWERGADAVTSLAMAQRSVRDSFAHPAFWAPFIVTQNTNEENTL